MPSRQSPLQVPQIYTPSSSTPTSTPPEGRTPSPEISYFSPRPPRTQTRPKYSGDFVASLSTLQRAPPANLLSTFPTPESQPQSRQDSNYFTPTSHRSHSRHTRTTSPSDNLSNPSCFSPGLSSDGSFYSSDTGRSPCSYNSSDFLIPPQGQPDTDNPPYKARRASSESLTMVRKLRRANTIPYDKEHKRRRRYRKHHKCGQKKVKIHEYQNRSYWLLPAACQVAPTAPAGQKQLCENHREQYSPRHARRGNIDTHNPLCLGLRSKLAPVVVTRRWSSVEIGAHQVLLESTLPVKPNTPDITSSPQNDIHTPINLDQRYRSSTFTRGAIDQDIVRTVRERLTLRKVPREELVTPASITLRKASGEMRQSFFGSEAGASTPITRQNCSLNKRRLSAAYLITTEDIDSITELIQTNLKRGYSSNSRFDLHAPSLTPPSRQGTPSPSITNRGVVPTNGFPADLVVTVAEVQPINVRPHSPLDYLQVIPSCKNKKDTIARTHSQKSFHEIIWQGGGSPRSVSTVADEDDIKRSAMWEFSSEPATPMTPSLYSADELPQPLVIDKCDAFDPKNAKASISEWSWRCPRNEIPVVVTSSDSDSNDVSPAISGPQIPPMSSFLANRPTSKGKPSAGVRPPLRSVASETMLQVVSFPPLPPRKTTNDWYSPLPPMEISPPPLTTSQSLYDIGIDVSFGPSSSKTVTPKSSQTSWVRSTEVSPGPSIEFSPNYEIKSKSPDTNLNEKIRQKSVIKAHPSAFARTGDSSAVGSSIGASSGERRKSSTLGIQRKASPHLCDSSRVKSFVGYSSGERQGPPSWLRRKESPRPGDVFRTEAFSGTSVGERKGSPPRSPHEPSPPLLQPIPTRPPTNAWPEGRRKSSSPRIQRVRTIDNAHKGEHEAPTKWRAPSPFPTPRSPSPSEYEDARESLPNSPSAGRNSTHIRNGWVDRLGLIRDRSPPLPAIDRVGIYGRMTGSQGTPRDDPCQDPCFPLVAEPHDCDDCMKDPRTPSIDWIG
jgi:hypothetical protein